MCVERARKRRAGRRARVARGGEWAKKPQLDEARWRRAGLDGWMTVGSHLGERAELGDDALETLPLGVVELLFG